MEVSGSKKLKVDAKGRVFIPKAMLEFEVAGSGQRALLTQLWLLPGLDGALWVLDRDEWRRMQKRIRVHEVGDARLRAVQRLLFASVVQAEPDAQGRILLPDQHRKHAKIAAPGEAWIVGVGRRIEVWAPQVFGQYKAEAERDWNKDLEAILSGGEGPM